MVLEVGKGRESESFYFHPCCIEMVAVDTQKDLQERKKMESFLGGLGFTIGKGLCHPLGTFTNE